MKVEEPMEVEMEAEMEGEMEGEVQVDKQDGLLIFPGLASISRLSLF